MILSQPILAASLPIIERTSSTALVQQVVQLSLAPVFLLAAIGAVMNVMTTRLIWIAERIERITALDEEGHAGAALDDLPALEKRRVYTQAAVMFSTAAALIISFVIALLFVSAFVEPQLGTLVAFLWVVTMVLQAVGLGFFLLETRTAATRNRKRLRLRPRPPSE